MKWCCWWSDHNEVQSTWLHLDRCWSNSDECRWWFEALCCFESLRWPNSTCRPSSELHKQLDQRQWWFCRSRSRVIPSVEPIARPDTEVRPPVCVRLIRLLAWWTTQGDCSSWFALFVLPVDTDMRSPDSSKTLRPQWRASTRTTNCWDKVTPSWTRNQGQRDDRPLCTQSRDGVGRRVERNSLSDEIDAVVGWANQPTSRPRWSRQEDVAGEQSTNKKKLQLILNVRQKRCQFVQNQPKYHKVWITQKKKKKKKWMESVQC